MPYIPGADASGIVEKVGSDVQNLSMGQRVFVTGRNSGSYAEYIVTEAIYVFPLHHRLTFAQGAALGVPYFTAYKALIMGAKVFIFLLILILRRHSSQGGLLGDTPFLVIFVLLTCDLFSRRIRSELSRISQPTKIFKLMWGMSAIYVYKTNKKFTKI